MYNKYKVKYFEQELLHATACNTTAKSRHFNLIHNLINGGVIKIREHQFSKIL